MIDDVSLDTRWRPFQFGWRERFDPETECQYLDESAARSLPFIQGTLVLLIAFYIAVSLVGDQHIAPVGGAEIWTLRLPLLLVLFGSLATSISKWPRIQPDLILAIVVSTASVTSSYVATLDPAASFRVVASHLGLGIIAVAVASRFSSIVVMTLFLLVVPNAVFAWNLGGTGLLVTADLFLFFGACQILFLGYMTDQRRRQLFKIRNELTRMARTDGLTEVSNRRFFIETAQKEVARSSQYGYPFSCLILDIDSFKVVNDTYGHQAGNVVLKQMTQAIRRATRKTDIVGRLGGDEFAVALPQTALREAMSLAERIRDDLAILDVEVEGQQIRFTVSIGAARLTEDQNSIMSIMKLADRALYRAKRSGRNQSLAATEEDEASHRASSPQPGSEPWFQPDSPPSTSYAVVTASKTA